MFVFYGWPCVLRKQYVLFFSHPRSEGWPHHGRTFSIYPCPLSFWLTLPQRVLSTSWCCPSRPCVAFLAFVHLALFLALSLSPGNSLVSLLCDHSMLAVGIWPRPPRHQRQRAIAVRASRAAPPWDDWDRRYVGQWLRQCFCHSPPGILKYDFFAFGDIRLKVIRCSRCCDVVHLLLALAGVDWWNNKIRVVCEFHQRVAGLQWFQICGCDGVHYRPNAGPLDDAGKNARRWWLFPVEQSASRDSDLL